MNTSRIASTLKASRGYALLMVLAMGAVSAVILGATVTRTINTASLNEHKNQMTVNLNAAEAAVEKVIAHMMADYQNGGDAAVNNNLVSYSELVPKEEDHPYWGQFEFSDGAGNLGQTYVTIVSNNTYGPLESQYGGLYGWVTTYRIISNARQTTGRFSSHIHAVRQDIQIASIPLFQFAIFYNGLMEFAVNRDLTINGRTHANGDIFYTSSGPITFNAPVTATGTIQSNASWGMSSGVSTGPTTFKGQPDYRTNIAQLSLFIGTNNTSANLHKIIEMPASDESAGSLLDRERFYNKAGIVLLISNLPPSNTLITAMIKSSASDFDPSLRYWTYWTNTAPWTNTIPNFINTTNSFWDRRESRWMQTTEIDMRRLATWMSNTVAVWEKQPTSVLYVADYRTNNVGINTAVRLINGGILPRNIFGGQPGFTVATPNPLYVKGDYNTVSKVPAALVSDALTILSSEWRDSQSTSFNPRDAQDTTINAAIITGNVPSKGSTGNDPFSGGVVNLPRLLEDWNNEDLRLTNSLVNLFESTSATGPFTIAAFKPPRRYFFHDPSFADPSKLPPGTPMLSVLIRARWSSPPPNSIAMAPPED